MTEISINEAQNKLEELIEKTLNGEEIIITEKEIQLVRLVPFDEKETDIFRVK